MDSTTSKRPRFFFVSAILIVGLFGAFNSNCGEIDPEGVCEADLVASINSLNDASLAFVDAAESLKMDLATACYNIADDLEVEGLEPLSAEVTDEELRTVCGLAQAAIEAQVQAGVTVTVAIEGGRCEIDAQAQFNCEASCQVEGECDPGSVEVRCDPGDLSVMCDAECEASAYCQGSAEVAANCHGNCGGMCEGTCDGNTLEGPAVCEGECQGTCTGECEITVEGGIECGADVRCRGGCSVEGTAPTCEAELDPPSCDIDADCQAGCDGQASFEAECTPPQVAVVIDGDAHVNLATTLSANLPDILNAARYKGQLLLDAAGDVLTSAGQVGADLASSALCIAAVGGQVVGNLEAVATASASVSVSVEVSVDVSASAGAN